MNQARLVKGSAFLQRAELDLEALVHYKTRLNSFAPFMHVFIYVEQ